jgi:murein DD-endopeptidase MepM/ murein hydrolase activator NlpD
MKFKKIFLLLIVKNISDSYILSTYNINNCIKNHNLFEVVIPIKMINNSLNFYLPSNLKEEDKNKIINFIIKNKHINNSNNNKIFYKISFYKNYEEASLNKIILYENNNNTIKNINILNNIDVLNDIEKNKLIKKNTQHPNIMIIHLENKKELTVNINNLTRILDLIDVFISKKYNNQICSYKIFYDKINKKILGIKVYNKDINEFLYILYSPKKTKYIILDSNFQNIQSTIMGLYKSTPLKDTFKKLRSPFGTRRDPFTRKIKMHQGQDITTPLNTPIKTIEDGIIVDCGYNRGYGYFIVVHHGNSTRDSYSSVYCHLNNILLPIGSKVLQNQVIGLSGSTGRSTGPHLHFEWVNNKDGNRVNPVKVYYQNKKISPFFQRKLEIIKKIIDEICLYEI